ncbi:hypothetical protein ACVWZB_004563 [Paenibacillus polymyxa]|jgi:macrolide phosphotransferase
MTEKRPLTNPNDVSDILALAQNNGLHIQHEGLELNESGLDFRAYSPKTSTIPLGFYVHRDEQM